MSSVQLVVAHGKLKVLGMTGLGRKEHITPYMSAEVELQMKWASILLSFKFSQPIF